MKHYILSAILALGAGTALATDYYIVAASNIKTKAVPTIQVEVNPMSLPSGQVGQVYAGFNFNSVLRVTGDTAFDAAAVQWSVAGGVLPAGLSLSLTGQLTGTPAGAGTSTFQVAAAYKGKSGAQTYDVTMVSRPAQFDPASIGGWTSGLSLASTNSALDVSGTVWTVSGRPAGQTGKALNIKSNARSMPDNAYLEVVSTTKSAWILLLGADGKTNGIALDGPGCNRNSTYVASCTANSSGNWANSRFGVQYEKAAGRVTIYRGGTLVFQQTGVPAQVMRLYVQDRDVPVNASARTYTMYNTPQSWSFAPTGAEPFWMD